MLTIRTVERCLVRRLTLRKVIRRNHSHIYHWREHKGVVLHPGEHSFSKGSSPELEDLGRLDSNRTTTERFQYLVTALLAGSTNEILCCSTTTGCQADQQYLNRYRRADSSAHPVRILRTCFPACICSQSCVSFYPYDIWPGSSQDSWYAITQQDIDEVVGTIHRGKIRRSKRSSTGTHLVRYSS